MKARDTFQRLGWGVRGRQRRHPLVAGILVLVLVAQIGCASSGVDKRSASSLYFPAPRPASQELGKVGVTSGRFVPTFDIVDGPSKKTSGCTYDRPKGFRCHLEGLLLLMMTPVVVPLLFAALPVVLIAETVKAIRPGSAVETAEPAVKVEERKAATHEIVATETIQEDLSAMTTEPTPVKTAEVVDERVAAARKLIASQRLQDELRDRVVAISQVQTPHTFAVLVDQGPTAVDERPGYRSLSQEGIQTVLEIVVESVTLNDSGPWSTSSSLRMEVIVRIRLIRTVDDERIYVNWVTYKGEKEQTLEEWISDPESLRHELNSATDDIVKKTVEEIFLRPESN